MLTFSRREPLLWLQILAFGVIPLELILLRLVLGGSEVGPIPTLERILIWAISVLFPTLKLWEKPADWASLLLIRHSVKKRSEKQLKLSNLQVHPINQLSLLLGCLSLLVILWKIDESAILVYPYSPLKDSSRVITLLISIPLLTIILWQWHQSTQSIWLLTRDQESLDQTIPLSQENLEEQRTSLGLGILNMKELIPSSSIFPLPIKPQKPSEEEQCNNLNSSIAAPDDLTQGESQAHNQEAEESGSKQSKP